MALKDKIRVIEDFPKEGISFKDITTVIGDGETLRECIDALAGLIEGDVDAIVGPEARGFILGTPLAYKLGCAFVPVRKPGKLPYETIRYEYELEYGTDILEMHKDAIRPGDKVVIVDDLAATGGTFEACAKMIESLGGEVTQIVTLIELTGLKPAEKLAGYNFKSVVQYEF